MVSRWLPWFLLATALAMPVARGERVAADRPNVLLICVDDLKPALGCYGDTAAKTPNIDRLAARGVRFDAAYTNQAVCSPSRNALLTGLRPQTLGIYDLGTNFRLARPSIRTLPQLFRDAGWHAAGCGRRRAPTSSATDDTPASRRHPGRRSSSRVETRGSAKLAVPTWTALAPVTMNSITSSMVRIPPRSEEHTSELQSH